MRILRCKRGATAIEYSLIAGLISVAAMGAVSAVGGSVSNTFCEVAGALNGTGNCVGMPDVPTEPPPPPPEPAYDPSQYQGRSQEQQAVYANMSEAAQRQASKDWADLSGARTGDGKPSYPDLNWRIEGNKVVVYAFG